jgi:hypothetical protein
MAVPACGAPLLGDGLTTMGRTKTFTPDLTASTAISLPPRPAARATRATTAVPVSTGLAAAIAD